MAVTPALQDRGTLPGLPRVEKLISLGFTIGLPDWTQMNIEHMRTFLEVAATANFNRAAERLNVSQSTVSARISRAGKVPNTFSFPNGEKVSDIFSAQTPFCPPFCHGIKILAFRPAAYKRYDVMTHRFPA